MAQQLDNPVWHALTTAHAPLALGEGAARRYPADVTPFCALAEPSAAAYADLAAQLSPGEEARLFRPAEEPTPPGWETLSVRPIVQMTAERLTLGSQAMAGQVALELSDAPAMLTLAQAAQPGPVAPRACLLGRYLGVKWGGRLIAMAGERFRFPGHVELSAICVHPDARGAGLGRALTLRLAADALARGETPFLHVFAENPARELYARLGFRERTKLWVVWRRPRA